MSEIRTRFAPSPTGYLHLGSARTALFNWAFARHHGGRFLLRIEDTDADRSTRESEEGLIRGLEWLGLEWDEGPYRQSEHAERHRSVVEDLLARGRAYRCICTKEELEARKLDGGNRVYDGRCRHQSYGPDCGPHTVRLRQDPDAQLGWRDLVFGPSGQAASEIGDAIVRRSDGTPLYNLAVVVDDIDLGVTHVIRGADHHSNTPLQIAIYKAMEVEPPLFAHVPLIVNESGKKLSKRRDPVSIEHYRDEGYLAEAMVNWLVRIGWSHGDQEIFSSEEIIREFGLEPVGRAGARADIDKLQWLNQHYLKQLPMDDLFTRACPYLEAEAGGKVEASEGLATLLDELRERSHTLAEMAQQARWLVRDDVVYDEKAAKKYLKPDALEILVQLREAMTALEEWSLARIESAFTAVSRANDDLKMGKLAQPVRVAVTGGPVSPGIYETLVALGRERTLERMDRAIELVRARQ